MISFTFLVTVCANKTQTSRMRKKYMRGRNFPGIKIHEIFHSQLKFISSAEIALIAFLMIFRRQNGGADAHIMKKWHRERDNKK